MIVSVYTDGGVIRKNPSEVGGTWAYCLVDEYGIRQGGQSGLVTPQDIGQRFVTNNVTELAAVLAALTALPDGWDGTIYTDSKVTMSRVSLGKNGRPRKPQKVGGFRSTIPDHMVNQLQIQQLRMGHYQVALVKGHASMDQIAASYNGDQSGQTHSRHNSWCDKECRKEAELFLRNQKKEWTINE